VVGICNSVSGGAFFDMPPRCRWRIPAGVKAKVVLARAACNDIKVRSFASHRGRPPTPPSTLAVGDVCGRRRTEGTSKNRTASCQTWEIVTLQMTVVEIIIADLHCLSNGGRRVMSAYVCSWMWSVPAIKARVRRVGAVSTAQELRNIDSKCRTAAPHTRNQD